MSKTKSMDDYIRETRSYALQFEASGFKKNAEFMYDLADYLKSLPTPAVADTNVGGKWIPCSEKMPDKEYELYWTTHEDGSIVLHGYTKKNGFIYNWEVDDLELRKRQGRVVAWMLIPMPEPYKGE